MNGLSKYLLGSITQENQRKAYRVSRDKRHAQQMAETTPEDVHNQPEVLNLSPEEQRRQETNRLAYERMARGSALAEAEYAAQKLQQRRQ